MISFSQFTTNRSKTKITIDSKLEKNSFKHCFLTSSAIKRTYFSCLGPFSPFFSCGTQKNIQKVYQNIVPQFFAHLLQPHFVCLCRVSFGNLTTIKPWFGFWFVFFSSTTNLLEHVALNCPSRRSHATLQVTETINIDWLEL